MKVLAPGQVLLATTIAVSIAKKVQQELHIRFYEVHSSTLSRTRLELFTHPEPGCNKAISKTTTNLSSIVQQMKEIITALRYSL